MRGKNGDNRAHHLVLEGKDILKVSVVVLGPEVRTRIGFDQLGRYSDAVAGAPHAALQNIAHTQFATNPAYIDRLALVLEAGVAGDDEELREPRQFGDDVFDDAVDQIFLLRVRAHIVERQHGNRWFVWQHRFWGRGLFGFERWRGLIQQDAVDVHGALDILELALTNIFEGDAEPAQATLDVLLHSARDAHTSSFRQCFQSRRHVYAVAMAIVCPVRDPRR